MVLIPFYIFIFIFTICIAFEIYSKHIRRQSRLVNQLPGPPEWPVIGSMLDIFQSREVIFKTDRKVSLDYYPIYRKNLLARSFVVIVNPEDMELILTDMKQISKGFFYDFLSNWLGNGLLTSTGEKWHKRRKILTPAFHFNILMDFLNIINEETRNLVEVLRKRCGEPYIDVVKPITEYTLNSINETAMGVKLSVDENKSAKYKHSVYRIGELTIYRSRKPWLYNDLIYSLSKTGKEEEDVLDYLHNFTEQVIEQRAKDFDYKAVENFENVSYSSKKRLAMLDLLLVAQNNREIDHEGIREEVDTFMFEGHDTTSMALCFILLLIANHREIQDKLVDEMREILGDSSSPPTYNDLNNLKYMDRCIKESLRLYPSVPVISRTLGEDVKTKTGYLIPKDTDVVLIIYDMHHNPNVFEDPEKFDPDRFLPENTKNRHPFAYIPFSGGPRNCIGQKFAMMELKAALCGILEEFILEPVHRPQDVVIVTDIVLRPNENGVRIKFRPRKF